MKKRYMALLCIVMAGMVLSGCAAGSAGSLMATASPAATQSPRPAATLQVTAAPTIAPMMSPEATSGADMASNASMMTPAEAGRLADKIEEAVERISEVDDAEAVVSDDRVLVAVEFDDQYKAGLDERMKQMIVDTVREVDANIGDIEITDDDTLYGQVKNLGDKLAKATGLDELADDFGDLWNRITGM